MDQKELREIDAQVAEKVMGWKPLADRTWVSTNGRESGEMPCPHYSSRMEDAWEVLGAMHGREGDWGEFDRRLRMVMRTDWNANALHELEAGLAARVICKAALAALSSVKEGE